MHADAGSLARTRVAVAARIVGRERELELILAAVAAGRDVLLEGPPGTSKSTLLRAITAEWGVPLVFVEGNTLLTAMAEREVAVPRVGRVRSLPTFRVIATMNPFDTPTSPGTWLAWGTGNWPGSAVTGMSPQRSRAFSPGYVRERPGYVREED